MRCRVVLYAAGTGRGPTSVTAIIEDADEVGVAENANASGRLFFTLPYDHWAHALISPRVTHVQIQRQEEVGATWATVGWGLVVDFDHTPYDVIYYAADYLSLFEQSLTALKTKYTNQACSFVIQTEAQSAISQANSRVGFISIGTIDTTSATMSALSDYQSRLELMRNAAQVVQEGLTARPIFSISHAAVTAAPAFALNFAQNKGSRNAAIELRWGGVVSNFHVLGGYEDMPSSVIGIAQKTAGATVLYSTQAGCDAATYGLLETPVMYGVLPSQVSLDAMTASDAKIRSQPYRSLALAILSGSLSPTDLAIADAYPVTISRGRLNLDHVYYTLWGWRWIGHKSGQEDLLLSVLPETLGLSAAPDPLNIDTPSPSSTAAASGGQITTHRVVSGDTLGSLARQWHTTPTAIQAATNAQVGKISGVVAITSISVIRIGKLVVRP